MSVTSARPHLQPARPTPTFQGQQAGEQIVLLERDHWYTLMLPALPVVAFLVLLASLFWWQLQQPDQQALFSLLITLTAAVTLLLLLRWGIIAALPWWYRVYIVTNLRVIFREGILTAKMQEIQLSAIQGVYTNEAEVMQRLLGFGCVTITAAGGTRIQFTAIARPEYIAARILETHTAHAPRTSPTTTVLDDALQHALATVATPEPMPVIPRLDSVYSFRWPLSTAFHFPLEQGEEQIGIISRHWIFLLQSSGRPLICLGIALVIGCIAVAVRTLSVGLWAGIFALIAVLWELVIYLNFADDVFLLTTRRMIDIERSFFLLQRKSTSIEYERIQEVKTVSPGLLSRFLHFGTVIVNVAGNADPLLMNDIPYPMIIEQAISRNITLIKERKAAVATNKEKSDLKEWFGAVLGELIVAAPDLRGLPLELAMQQATALGFHPAIMGESAVVAGVPAGIVVSQLPLPGSRALRGGDLSLVLSRMM